MKRTLIAAVACGLFSVAMAFERLSRPWPRAQRCRHCPHKVTDSPRSIR